MFSDTNSTRDSSIGYGSFAYIDLGTATDKTPSLRPSKLEVRIARIKQYIKLKFGCLFV